MSDINNIFESAPIDRLTIAEQQDQKNSDETSSWLNGAIKGFSAVFSSFIARFCLSSPKDTGRYETALKGNVQDRKNLASSQNWESSFSLKNWISKGLSFSFGKKSDQEVDRNFLTRVNELVDNMQAFSGKHDQERSTKTLEDLSAWNMSRDSEEGTP